MHRFIAGFSLAIDAGESQKADLLEFHKQRASRCEKRPGAFPMHDVAFDQEYLMANGYLAYYRENVFKG